MTAFTDIYDIALVVMQDYKLDNLANTNYDAFLIFMKGLLKNGIPFFNCCLKSLEFEDVELNGFEDVTQEMSVNESSCEYQDVFCDGITVNYPDENMGV